MFSKHLDSEMRSHSNNRLLLQLLAASISSILVLPIPAQSGNTAEIKAESKRQTVRATRDYQGEHYFLPGAKEVKIYRKKDVYAMPASTIDINALTKASSMSIEPDHQLGNMMVFRMSAQHAGQKSTNAFPVGAEPVFTNEHNQVDMLIKPAIVVHINPGEDLQGSINVLQAKYNVSLREQLPNRKPVLLFDYLVTPLNYGNLFQTMREIASESFVKLAEPDIHGFPQKLETPSDDRFFDQWYLHNVGQNGGLCDADIDLLPAWELDGVLVRKGAGVTIAILDDGVQLNHPDILVLGTGDDRVDDSSVQACEQDGQPGPDSDASPHIETTGCLDPVSEEEDHHGTAVAGLAAARENGTGTVGVAPLANIYPMRLISDYGTAVSCTDLPGAFAFAASTATGASVINGSWAFDACEGLVIVEDMIEDVVDGNSFNSARPAPLGVPMIFSSGNSASGWRYFERNVSAGSRTFRWQYAKDAISFPGEEAQNAVWLDDIRFPDGSVQNFDAGASSLSSFSSSCTVGPPASASDQNQCGVVGGACSGDVVGHSWDIFNQDPLRTRSATGFSVVAGDPNSVGSAEACEQIKLETTQTVASGTISFWYWLSTERDADYFEFYIDGQLVDDFTPQTFEQTTSHSPLAIPV